MSDQTQSAKITIIAIVIAVLLFFSVTIANCQSCVTSSQVMLTGNLRSANGLPAKNYTISMTPSQQGFIAGCGVNIATPFQCATSTDGSVVLLPNPVTATVNTTSGTGSLTAGVYYSVYEWYDSLGHVSLPGPETVTTLSATGALVVNPPSSGIPSTATGMEIFIGTTSGGETLQGSTTGSASFVQSTALASGASPATSNNSVCVATANDSIWPSGTGYITSLTTPAGNSVPGYPMQWQLNGAGTTINLSNGLPYYHGVVTFPVPILAQPQNHGSQSINGPLSTNGYNLLAGLIGSGTLTPGYGVDVEGASTAGQVNAKHGFLANGVGGTANQGLCSDGTAFDQACNFLTSATIYYQTADANGTPQTQRPVLNFSPRFALSDSASPAQTNVDLAASGVTASSYSCPNVTFNTYGQATSATNGACSPSFTGGSGYQSLPSGLVLQWAQGSACTSDCTQTVSFPIPFPHACFTVQTTNLNVISTNVVKDWAVNSPCTTTGVLLQLQRRGDEGSFSAAPIVFAIGW